MLQESIALGIVLGAALYLGRMGFNGSIAPVLSNWLLKRGHVKMAMRLRTLSGNASLASSCGNCPSSGASKAGTGCH